ncbi:MAG: DUF5684 domain-containing protein [Verrucomicrobia bacterium]|jgi:hypothetical protein|nr:DUF5684 domain-containing protein [Verrucomicrobiota bacterium]
MKTERPFIKFLIRSAMAVLLGIGLALLLNLQSVAKEAHLDVLQTKTDVYRDVTVTGHSQTDIFIVHSGGMANVKIKDLDPETLWRTGLGEKPLEPGSPEAAAASEAAAKETQMPAALAKVLESAPLPAMDEAMRERMASLSAGQSLPIPKLDPRILIIGVAILLAIHLFFSFCLKLIVEKTGNEPGFMVWLPVFQVFPMLRAAGMSGWWVLGMLIPLVNIIVQILWCVKIVQARGKSFWVTIFLILPGPNVLAFLYLAFSSANNGAQGDPGDEQSKLVIQSAFSEA